LAPRVGLEPTTLRLTAACSTIELPRSNGSDGLAILVPPSGRVAPEIQNEEDREAPLPCQGDLPLVGAAENMTPIQATC
jgi:hypothetical protein